MATDATGATDGLFPVAAAIAAAAATAAADNEVLPVTGTVEEAPDLEATAVVALAPFAAATEGGLDAVDDAAAEDDPAEVGAMDTVAGGRADMLATEVRVCVLCAMGSTDGTVTRDGIAGKVYVGATGPAVWST